MGTSSVRRGSHPVIPVAVAAWRAQVTVIVVEVLNRGVPSFFFPILRLSYLRR